jgi:hypothetical protein
LENKNNHFRVVIPSSQYLTHVAPEALEVKEDFLLYPEGVMFPLSVRIPHAQTLHGLDWHSLVSSSIPTYYSIALRKEMSAQVARSLRAKRTLMEGVLLALAEKGGRRPSIAEQIVNQQMDETESRLTLGEHAFTTYLLSSYCVPRNGIHLAEEARKTISSLLQAKGIIPQRFTYIAERSLLYAQPGGDLIPKEANGPFMLNEILPLLPQQNRRIMPDCDSVWIGSHARTGRDVYYSFTSGFDPQAEKPPHATTLILGEMGSGKTTLMRSMLLQRILQNRIVVTLDPEGEYNAFCREMGGHVLSMEIPEEPNLCLLHPLTGSTPEEMLLAARFLISALRSEPTSEEFAVLHDAVLKYYAKNPKSVMSITELRELLAVQNSPFTTSLVSILRIYSKGGILEGLFDRPSALLSNEIFQAESSVRWINFDLSKLREENRSTVYMIMTWFLYNAVAVGRFAFDVFIDEGWRLLSGGGVLRDVLDELGRRARKRGIGIVLITHLPGDLVSSSTILMLASNAFVGRLGINEAYNFMRLLGTPETEARQKAEWIASLPPRVFLAVPAAKRSSIFPVRVVVPDAWLQFWKQLQGK